MCTLKSLLKQYFLLLITFCTYFERCSNFEFEAIQIFYVIVSKCKWVSRIDNYEAEIAADSIIWELFARKSAECLNHRNSFITISRFPGSGRATSVFWPLAKSVILRTLVSPHFMRRVTMFGPSKFKRRGCQTQDFMSVKSHTMTMLRRNSRCQSGSSF